MASQNIKFRNNKGETRELAGSLTIADLGRMGISFHFAPKGSRLKDGVWASVPPARSKPKGKQAGKPKVHPKGKRAARKSS
jgi:hypothetical protein